jgi:hypothetical protein
MLRHHHIPVDQEVVAFAHCLKRLLEPIACFGISKIGETLVTAERHK